MSLTIVLSTDEDISCNPDILQKLSNMHGICMEERGVHCIEVRRSKSEDTVCRLSITMAEETGDMKMS